MKNITIQQIGKGLFVYGGALVIAISGFFIVSNLLNASVDEVHLDEQEYWVQQIEKKGGKNTYADLIRMTSTLDSGRQHGIAHLFGGALYEVEALKGLSTCDGQLSYGCIHEYIGSAIAAEGIEVVKKLNEFCADKKNSSGCQHGIGHGLIGFLGYTKESLQGALDLCDELPGENSIFGCGAGVYMEYNLRDLLSLETKMPARKVVNGNWQAPCDDVRGYSQSVCYLLQPQWWWVVIQDEGLSPKEIYARSIELCEDSHGDSHDVCLAGVGRMIPQAVNFEIPRIQELCDTAHNRNQALLCRAFSAELLLNTVNVETAQEVCDDLRDYEFEYCSDYATGRLRVENIQGVQPIGD